MVRQQWMGTDLIFKEGRWERKRIRNMWWGPLEIRRMLTYPKYCTWLTKLGAFCEKRKARIQLDQPNSFFQMPCSTDRTFGKHVHTGPLSQKFYPSPTGGRITGPYLGPMKPNEPLCNKGVKRETRESYCPWAKDVQGPGWDAGIGGLRQPLGETRADPGGDSVNFTIQDADKCLPHLDKMVSMGNLMGGGPFGPDTRSESMQTAEPDSGGASWG